MFKPLLRALRYLGKYWHLALATFICLILATVATLFIPKLGQLAIDQGILQRNWPRVLRLSLGVVAFALVGALFQFARGALAARTA